MYLVCFFGVIGRSIQYTRGSHVAHILDVLQKHNISYKVLVVNNNIGHDMIDGERIENDDQQFIPSDFRVELKQQEIDYVITKKYPRYWDLFHNCKYHCYTDKECCLNVMRQSYVEQCVSSHISEEYEKVIAISADFNIIHDIPIHDIIQLKESELMVSDMNHARGYTNGLYIGTSNSVKKTMNHFDSIKDFDIYSYEHLIKKNAEKHDIRVIVKHILFAKIRANREVFLQRNNRLKQKIVEALNRDYPLQQNPSHKICFITAIYGDYEASCKRFVKQTIGTDFICFTDDNSINNNGWIINTHPYHKTHNTLDTSTYTNSMCNNTHTFNIAKYYKQSFHNIPILKQYDVIVWLDGTLEITYEKTSEYIVNSEKKIIGWHHEKRNGKLGKEVKASHFHRYTSTFWNGQVQPYQDVDKQYQTYVNDGYTDAYFKNMSHSPHFGVWITCFVAFFQHDPDVKVFLDTWYMQTLKYTTQDQIGFPYVCQRLQHIPYTLPQGEIWGDNPHRITMFYIKHEHGV
jgi:hypothetical protein